MREFIVSLTILVCCLGVRIYAAKGCPGDTAWSAAVGITRDSSSSVTMTASTSIVHVTTHNGCDGNCAASVDLAGVNGNGPPNGCSHSVTGFHSFANVSKSCSNLSDGGWYTNSTHSFGGTVEESKSSSSVSTGDHDGDGYAIADGDCADGDYNIHPNAAHNCDTGSADYDCDGMNDATECGLGSPILIDLDGAGFKLTAHDEGVLFDVRASGTPEQVAWTSASSGDGWLALDRNGNGIIDDGRELFGNATPQSASAEPNGYLALAEYDRTQAGGNADRWIDSADAVYPKLRIWVDWNHDGAAEPTELMTLTQAGVTRISLDFEESQKRDRHGNLFRYRARVRYQDDMRGQRAPFTYDVYIALAHEH
ncbi:hypothetical protein TBR22_A42560 [Luteitalea sp. TBR-22]|uniref:hypothetical protein n=1 Tax=Luteitalea sp. TBR-22 TaxID=2802971 RepID=UPI001AF0D58C|nr:hypothetical protein [Luteitalea sp. TBR-22]BCS35030.1 hypothetical protein TBR22_A42560 [Luteitalea sp. TBR-22]